MTATKSVNRLGASIIDLTFVVWALTVPTLLRSRLFTSDGDFARHLRMGRFILQRGPWFTDDLAWTHTGPFFTTEWLSQTVFALADRVAGLAGVAVVAGFVVGLAYALVVVFMRRAGVDPLLAFVTGMAAAVLGAPHWVARPHLFTFVGLAVLMNLALTGHHRRLGSFALLFFAWANLHGGFILGLVVLLVIAVAELVESRLAPVMSGARREWAERAGFHGMAVVAGSLAAMLNPMGPRLYARVASILGNRFLIATAAEFQPLDFHTMYGRLFLMTIVLGIAVLARRTVRPPLAHLAVILLLLAAAFSAGRNAPLFALVALPLLAVGATPQWYRSLGKLVEHACRTFADGEAMSKRGRAAAVIVIGLAGFALAGGRIAGSQLITNGFDTDVVPVTAIERARAAGLRGRMFNELRWGGYILLAWPEQRIYIDGMTDFFGNEVLSDYLHTIMLDPGWAAGIEDRDIEIVILPPGSRLVAALRNRPGWSEWYADQVAVVLTRQEGDAAGEGDTPEPRRDQVAHRDDRPSWMRRAMPPTGMPLVTQ